MPDIPEKTYLGDAVYIQVAGSGVITLTTEDGIDASNTIYLEPEVAGKLVAYLHHAKWVRDMRDTE